MESIANIVTQKELTQSFEMKNSNISQAAYRILEQAHALVSILVLWSCALSGFIGTAKWALHWKECKLSEHHTVCM